MRLRHSVAGGTPPSPYRHHAFVMLCASAATAAAQPRVGYRVFYPQPPATQTAAACISGDGRVVGGNSIATRQVASVFEVPFYLASPLHLPPGELDSIPLAANNDGSVLVGYWQFATGGGQWGWVSRGGRAEEVGRTSDASSSIATDTSDDGSIVIGASFHLDRGPTGWMWTPDDGLILLPDRADTSEVLPHAVSGDGRVIIGMVLLRAGGMRPFRWTREDGLTLINPGAGPQQMILTDVSRDGSIACGYRYDPETQRASGFRLTFDGPEISLGRIANRPPDLVPNAISADGSRIVGDNQGRAFVWDIARGPRLLDEALHAAGVDLNNWNFASGTGISDDGTAISVQTIYPQPPHVSYGGVVFLDEGCLGDFNRDGGTDGSDVETFFRAWEAADESADVNLDGGVDGRDTEAFFLAWEAGC